LSGLWTVTVTKSVSVEAVWVSRMVVVSVSVETVVVTLVVERRVSLMVVETVGRTVIVDVIVLVAGVTVTARYDEQSAAPCLVGTAEPMIAVTRGFPINARP
jgi:uncharacterized membrane protein YkgB